MYSLTPYTTGASIEKGPEPEEFGDVIVVNAAPIAALSIKNKTIVGAEIAYFMVLGYLITL